MAKEEENKAILVHWRRRLMSTASGGPRFWATVNLMEVWQLLPIGHNGHSPVCEIAIAKKRRVAKTLRGHNFGRKIVLPHFEPLWIVIYFSIFIIQGGQDHFFPKEMLTTLSILKLHKNPWIWEGLRTIHFIYTNKKIFRKMANCTERVSISFGKNGLCHPVA